MSNPDLAQWAAATLTEVLEASPARLPAPSRPDRAAAIDALEHALRRRRRRPLLMIGTGAAALAAVASVSWLATRGSRPPVTASTPAPAVTVSRAMEVARNGDGAEGGEVRPGDVMLSRRGNGPLLLRTAGGTRLSLAEDGELAVVETGKSLRFRLTRGHVHAEVAPLGKGERFVIQTPDAAVEVHGTVFDVMVVPREPTCRGGTITRVAVTRGIVAVGSAVRPPVGSAGTWDEVRKGEHWPSECSLAPAVALAPARGTYAPRAADRRATPAIRGAAPPAADSRRSRADEGAHEGVNEGADAPTPLTEQNDLLAVALAHKLRGRLPQALSAVETLLRRWPAGPFVESAMAERMRLLEGLGDPRAREAARDYQRRFPQGFAVDEAGWVAREGR